MTVMRRRPTPGVVFKRAEEFFFLVVSRFSGLGTAILGGVLWCGSLYIVNVWGIIEQMCRVALIKYVY